MYTRISFMPGLSVSATTPCVIENQRQNNNGRLYGRYICIYFLAANAICGRRILVINEHVIGLGFGLELGLALALDSSILNRRRMDCQLRVTYVKASPVALIIFALLRVASSFIIYLHLTTKFLFKFPLASCGCCLLVFLLRPIEDDVSVYSVCFFFLFFVRNAFLLHMFGCYIIWQIYLQRFEWQSFIKMLSKSSSKM